MYLSISRGCMYMHLNKCKENLRSYGWDYMSLLQTCSTQTIPAMWILVFKPSVGVVMLCVS